MSSLFGSFTLFGVVICLILCHSVNHLWLVIHFAKIDTHLDQIADVFYLTEEDGSQIRDEERQNRIRKAILDVVSPEPADV